MAQHTTKFQHFPDPGVLLDEWLGVARLHPGAWKSVVKQVRAAVAQGLADAVQAEAAVPDADAEPPPVPEAASFNCYMCGQVFCRLHAFMMHARIVHGSRALH